MEMCIKKFDPNSEFYIAEDCHIIEMSNTTNDPLVSIANARVEPGVTTQWHRLIGIAERYVILQGQGQVEIDKLAPVTVNPGDVVVIPAMTPQRITNIGTEDLVFLAICTPRFQQSAYESFLPEV